MSQNRSHAVMAQRVEAHDSLDFFPTPPWATRTLCEWLKSVRYDLSSLTAWEPACGAGDMTRPLTESFKWVRSSDVHEYGFGHVEDFLFPDPTPPIVDWIITNPPFRLADKFALTAITRARVGVALLVRTGFLEGGTSAENRYATLFKASPPTEILQFCERVPMFKGRLDRSGSTATSYCWLVWRLGLPLGYGTRFHWLPHSRKRLERDSDYPREALA